MKQQAGDSHTHGANGNGGQPLIGYRMFGVPCGQCALPMRVMWVFKTKLEVWHLGTDERCISAYLPAVIVPHVQPQMKKPDGRKVPRRYIRCRHCDVRFMKPRNGTPEEQRQDLCKACRNQQELFTHDDITGAQTSHGISTQ